MITETAWQQQVWHPPAAALGKKQKAVFLDWHVERGGVLLPVRIELVERAWVDHRPGQNVGANLRPLLDQADANLPLVLRCQLPQPDRRGKA